MSKIFEMRLLDGDGVTELHRAAAQTDDAVPGRWFDAMRAAYQMPDATDDEIFHVTAGGIFQGGIANIDSHERAVAAAAALPDPVEFTPLTGPQ